MFSGGLSRQRKQRILRVAVNWSMGTSDMMAFTPCAITLELKLNSIGHSSWSVHRRGGGCHTKTPTLHKLDELLESIISQQTRCQAACSCSKCHVGLSQSPCLRYSHSLLGGRESADSGTPQRIPPHPFEGSRPLTWRMRSFFFHMVTASGNTPKL